MKKKKIIRKSFRKKIIQGVNFFFSKTKALLTSITSHTLTCIYKWVWSCSSVHIARSCAVGRLVPISKWYRITKRRRAGRRWRRCLVVSFRPSDPKLGNLVTSKMVVVGWEKMKILFESFWGNFDIVQWSTSKLSNSHQLSDVRWDINSSISEMKI